MNKSSLLSEPFELSTVKWRVGATNAKKLGVKPWEATSGIALAYIDARIVMDRLDLVLGVDGWQDSYVETVKGRVICTLKCRLDDEWISKSDGAGDTGTEGEKGAISDAFKRAAVKFGIGRYLYALPNTWVNLNNGKISNTPVLPSWALPVTLTDVDRQWIEAVKINNSTLDQIDNPEYKEKIKKEAGL